jgi:hypothetical protein
MWFCIGVKLGLTLREEHRLTVFANRELRRMFGLKIDKVTGGCRKLHNEERRALANAVINLRVL